MFNKRVNERLDSLQRQIDCLNGSHVWEYRPRRVYGLMESIEGLFCKHCHIIRPELTPGEIVKVNMP